MAATKTKVIKNKDQDTDAAVAALDGATIKGVARERAMDAKEKAAIQKREGRIFPEQIADLNVFNVTGMYHINYLMHEFRFVNHADNYVTFFYPHTKNKKGEISPTFIDVVRSERELEISIQKAAIMKEAGKTYYIYRPDQLQPLQEAPIADEGEDEDTDE